MAGSNPSTSARSKSTLVKFQKLDLDIELEFRLQASDAQVDYYVLVDATHEAVVDRALRRLFPGSTEIERAPQPPEQPNEEPRSALELHGHGTRHDEWQTRLQPVDRDHDLEFPLGSVVDTIADADPTVLYQALLTPKPDWRATAESRIGQLKRTC
jgi:hypothetical protein